MYFQEAATPAMEGIINLHNDIMASIHITFVFERGVEAPIVTLSRSIIVPFLQFSVRRDLRKKAYQAWAARGAHTGAHDNRSLALEMLVLRKEMAELLGYPDFAAQAFLKLRICYHARQYARRARPRPDKPFFASRAAQRIVKTAQ
jgi:hypothetical protein